MNTDFEQVEDAIIAQLKKEMNYLKTVKTYAGELEESDVRKMVTDFPAAFVIYRGGPETWIDGRTFNEKPTFAVLFASKHVGGQEKVRKDKVKGCYRLLKDGKTALTNKTFGIDMERLAPVRKYLVFTSKIFAVYGIDFETNFDTIN